LLCLFSCKSSNKKFVERKPSATFQKHLDHAILVGDSGYVYKAFRYLDSVQRSTEKMGTVDRFFYYMYFFNSYHQIFKDQDIALQYADSLLEIAAEEDDQPYLTALANYAKGDALFSKGVYDEAYEYIYTAKTLVRSNLDSCGLSDYNYRLGMILYRQKRFTESSDYFKEAYSQSISCPDLFIFFYRKQELLDNIALCYLKSGKHDSAMVYFRKALSLVDANKNSYAEKPRTAFEAAEAVIYGNMADAYRVNGNIDTAEMLYQKSIAINSQKMFDNVDAQYSRVKLASLYMNDNKLGNAKVLLDEIKLILDTLPENNIRRSWNDLMWQYYDKQKQSHKAFDYLLNYKNINDSITNTNREFIETDINERFKNMDNQYQLDILKKNNELKQRYLVLMIIGAILSMIILVLVYQSWRKSKKNIKLLTALNNRINEQKQRLETVLADLRFTNNEKDRILRVVAHDIRNPIAAIVSLTDLMMSDRSNYTEEQVEFLELIVEACTNALTLTKDILEVSTMNKDAMATEWVDINTLLSNCISLLRFKADEKKQEIILHPLDVPASLRINKEKIWRVINNLVVNAIKFSNSNSMIEVAAVELENEVLITIKDSGVGIPEQYKDKVFDMFTVAKRLGTAGEKSFGLGLSICKQIIEAHGGTITFESKEGDGTTFYITLPFNERQPQ
jgi:signal transduction histidine kinase